MLKVRISQVFIVPVAFVLLFGLSCSEVDRSGESNFSILEISSNTSGVSLFESGAEWVSLRDSLLAREGHFEMGSKFVCLYPLVGGPDQIQFDFEADFLEWARSNEVKETVQWMNGAPLKLGFDSNTEDPLENQVVSLDKISQFVHTFHGVFTVRQPGYVEVRPRNWNSGEAEVSEDT